MTLLRAVQARQHLGRKRVGPPHDAEQVVAILARAQRAHVHQDVLGRLLRRAPERLQRADIPPDGRIVCDVLRYIKGRLGFIGDAEQAVARRADVHLTADGGGEGIVVLERHNRSIVPV